MKPILHALMLGVLGCALTSLAQNPPPLPVSDAPLPVELTPVPMPDPPADPPPAEPAPALEPETPAVEPETPAAEPVMLLAVPVEAPAAEPGAPAAEPGAPAAEPEAPAAEPETPAAEPAMLLAVPVEAPVESPAAVPGTELPVIRAAEGEPMVEPAVDEDGVTSGADVVPLIVIDDVPLTDAIRNLARQSDLNFMFDPQITATNQPNISIRFENVTAQEALLAVLENYNLALDKQSKAKIARITLKDPKAEEPLFVKVIQLRYCDPTNLVEIVKPTLSKRSTVLGDQRTRQLIVTTTEREVEGLISLIDKLDSQTKQVLIEARILETAKNPQTIKGINWASTLEAQRLTFGNNLRQPDVDASLNPINHDLLPGIPRMIASTAAGFTPATAFLNADGVSAVLSFLNKDSETEVLATPRAVTLDNQPATLMVTRAFPIFQITPGSANSPAGATIQYTNLGTILTVTPRIAADNNISMRVVPEVSNIDGKDQQVLNGEENVANIYAIRRIETHVMIPSGTTLVMGGLINDASTKAYTKVPILGDVPVLGLAFRHSSKERKKQNLVIFVTPTIIQEGDFQVASTDFLRTRFVERPDVEANAWDSAKPHDWTKPVE